MTDHHRAAPPSSAESHRLILMPSGRQGDVPHGSTILEAARALGVEIESICGGRQTCGKCLVALERGTFPKHGITSTDDHLTPPDETESAYAAAHAIDLTARRMACTTRILGDVLIAIPEESQARKQVIRKAASDLTIEVDPAVRVYYIEIEPAQQGGPGDWQRLQAALAAEWDLPGLTIDLPALRTLQTALRAQPREGRWPLTVTVWQDRLVIRVVPGYDDTLLGLAVDVGTTTIAGHLVDLRTGHVLATEAMMNPQVRYGEDLMSRVSYAMLEADGTRQLNRAVLKALNDLAGRAAEAAAISPDAISDVVLVGNTIMHHVLLGIDPTELGRVPFTLATNAPVDLPARDVGLQRVNPGARVHLLPCIAGHVGADNVGVLLAEQPQLTDEITLIIDVGTNAEILLGNRHGMLSASSPTGPAFEGAEISHGQRAAPGAIERVRITAGAPDGPPGQVRYKVIGDERWSDDLDAEAKLSPTGICGSGIIEVVAELFTAGLIDTTGRFRPDAPARCPAVRFNGKLGEVVLAPADETATGSPILVTQKDIRAIQLAKGALYAGAKLLMNTLGIDHVDRIKLAGAFGSYISPRHAMVIGMIPDCDLARVSAVGNAAGDGARIALLNRAQRHLAVQAARAVKYVETGNHPDFQDIFIAAMPLPHAVDAFPHLTAFLPADRT